MKQIRIFLARYQKKIDDDKASKKAAEEKVQTKLSEYLKETLVTLRTAKRTNQVTAYVFYTLSVLPLGVAIIRAVYFSRLGDMLSQNPISLAITAFSQLVVIILLISISKLFFSLGKSFMVESVRNSDRIHAISFGKFFLDAYGYTATREEVLKAFSAWNIDDGRTGFRDISGADYDPKFNTYLDEVKDIISVLKK